MKCQTSYLKRVARTRPRFDPDEVVVLTDDDENDNEGSEMMLEAAKKKHRDPTAIKDSESWQEGKEELMVLLQQVCRS